ncbi:uroporphyrinogen-III synthase [Archaeoglobales archaeon]|mgnify:CR=1 FL=1|nr:MAG: uroporphyrinogen-III synthase [Archaeoglobales archaeon]
MKSIAILRPEGYLKKTEELFLSAGFNVVSVPFLKIEEEKMVAHDLHFDYAIVTSQTAARIILEDPNLLERIRKAKIISIGSSTAEVFEKLGLETLIPSKYDSATLYNEFKEELKGKKVAIFRSNRGDPALLKLSEVAEVREYVLYRIHFEHGEMQSDFLKKLIKNENFIDFIVFSSRMMVQSFFKLAEKLNVVEEAVKALRSMKVVAIGPPTKRELEKYGVNALIPEEYTFKGVLELIRS